MKQGYRAKGFGGRELTSFCRGIALNRDKRVVNITYLIRPIGYSGSSPSNAPGRHYDDRYSDLVGPFSVIVSAQKLDPRRKP